MMTLQPAQLERGQLSPYGLADWYRYLNLGYHVPLVGGSDKMCGRVAARRRPHLRPARRARARLRGLDGCRPRAATPSSPSGRWSSLAVEGDAAGRAASSCRPAADGDVEWTVESVALPSSGSRSIVGGLVAERGRRRRTTARVGQSRRCGSTSSTLDRAARARQLPRPTRATSPPTPAPCRSRSATRPLFSEAGRGRRARPDRGRDRLRRHPRPARRRARVHQQLRATLETALQPAAPAAAPPGRLPPAPAARPDASRTSTEGFSRRAG